MCRTLSDFQIEAEVKNSESPEKDLIFLGLHGDAVQVERYLNLAGIQVGEALRTPFSPDLESEGAALISLQVQDGRHILVVLADTLETLANATALLESGEFRDVIVSKLLGIIANSNAE